MKKFSILAVVFVLMVPGLILAADDDIPLPGTYEQITFTEKHDEDPAVSPDGKILLYASDRTGNYDIYIRQLGKAGDTQKTFHQKHERYPSWTQGSLLYASNRAGSWDLYKTDAEGGQGELQWSSAPGDEIFSSVHPKTGKLLFCSKIKRGLNLSFTTNDVDIAVADENPNQAQVVAQGIEPRWSPDGKRIVFSSRRTKNHDIWICPAEGGAAMQLTTDKKADRNPCFSPDGSRIVFASDRAGSLDLWVMNADGSRKMQLTSHPKDERNPFWGSNEKIYFVISEKTGTSNIYSIPAPE